MDALTFQPNPHLHGSLLADPRHLPLREPEGFGRSAVIAPHPDDETLACGGALALLRARGDAEAVRVIVVTDGTGSHPRSTRFPPAARRALREEETRAALRELGCPEAADSLTFLGLPDGALSETAGTALWRAAVEILTQMLSRDRVATVFVPWRRDPHPDHRATFALVRAALSALGSQLIRLVEYPVWIWERGETPDAPRADEAHAWRLDVSDVLTAKRSAIQQHRSQLGEVIDDDPSGFRLEPAVLSHFTQPWETFIESREPPKNGDDHDA